LGLGPADERGFFSPRWKSILGYEDHEIPNDLDEWSDRLHPDERERVLAANYAHINGTTLHYEFEYRMRHKDGSYRWILARGVALRDRSGQACRMAGSHVDITTWKQMEHTLLQAEQRYKAVVASAPCAILVVDADGRIRDANARAAHILGLSPDQLPARLLLDLCKRAVKQDGLPPSECELRDLLRADDARQPRRLLVSFRDDDGRLTEVALESHGIAYHDAAEPGGAVIFLQESAP
jgi:PAS domain S-box-containing protein